MDKLHIINCLIDYYANGKKSEFANKLGISPQAVSTWLDRGTFNIELIFAKCENISPSWLLTGEGSMIIEPEVAVENKEVVSVATPSPNSIPLIPIDAMAGFMTGNSTSIMEYECEHYLVPMFRGAEFLIPVKGSSMQPKYNSGDLVACAKIPLDTFFLWHKVYVIDTEQGVLIKRVERASDDEHILLVSDNPAYSPVELHKSHIHSLASVIGVIRLE